MKLKKANYKPIYILVNPLSTFFKLSANTHKLLTCLTKTSITLQEVAAATQNKLPSWIEFFIIFSSQFNSETKKKKKMKYILHFQYFQAECNKKKKRVKYVTIKTRKFK